MGTWRNLSSAYISDISVGILIWSPMLWPFALCATISIASKYMLRYKGRHLWNPSNLGVAAMLILASKSVVVLSIQWGNNMWAMAVIWIIGLVSIYRLRLFYTCATYMASSFVFALLHSWITGDPYLAALFIASFEFFFRLGEFIYAPFYGLFVVEPIAIFMEMWRGG